MRIYKTKRQTLARKRAAAHRYYRTPEGRLRTRAKHKRWEQRNPENVRRRCNEYYERHRERMCWEGRLVTMLLRIRRAEIARGRVPFDG